MRIRAAFWGRSVRRRGWRELEVRLQQKSIRGTQCEALVSGGTGRAA